MLDSVLSLFFASPRAAMERRNARGSEALNAVLDAAAAAGTQQQQAQAADGAAADVAGAGQALALQLQEEQTARQRAEALAQHNASKLRVAQEQLAEWAVEKDRDAQHVLQQAQQLEQALRAATAGPSASSDDVLKSLAALRSLLQDNAASAQAFAAQMRTDVDRSKRSSQQAGFTPDEDTDMKRQKEQGPADTESAEGGSTARAAAGDEEDVEGAAQGPAGAANGALDEDEDMAGGDDPQGTPNGHGGAGAAAAPPRRLAGSAAAAAAGEGASTWAERAKYIPMRLEQPERRLLRLLEAALNVSEYTDKVDILVWRNKTQRVHQQIKDICAILSGLVVAQDYRLGQQLVKDRTFADNEAFFQAVFEIGRRYKIMNPDKMRTEYGKLMYLLMDSADPSVQELLEFRCVRPLQTVAKVLEEKGAAGLLQDPLLPLATQEIVAGDRPRFEIQRDIKAKERARDVLARRYANAQLTQEQVLQAIYSLSDNNTYLLFNRDPIDRMLQYFHAFFRPDSIDGEFSLAIQGGRGGARLTHNHERQYHYVLQSLTLWREISTEMFKLWYLAEQDMLREGNSYRLCDTGQGLNRVQAAPAVGRAMQAILARCQSRIGGWVGSSVVHLGDHNVPNAFHFIDKYSQVPRILNPVVMVLDELPKLVRDPEIRTYLDSAFGGVDRCRKLILTDFCRHAFDGSGADNFFDAGSCIDGRLTSAWNWCGRLEKKAYFPVFRLAGFTSFDGDWKA